MFECTSPALRAGAGLGRRKKFRKNLRVPTPKGMTFRILLFTGLAAVLSACEPWQCNASTCVNGCCDATATCIVNGGSSKCGIGGAQCTSCATCTQGICGCEAGLGRVGNKCVCSATSCATGCCTTDYRGEAQCVQASSQSSSTCGTRGATCSSCSYPSTCGTNGCISCDGYGDSCSSGSCCSSYSCRYDSSFGSYRCGF